MPGGDWSPKIMKGTQFLDANSIWKAGRDTCRVIEQTSPVGIQVASSEILVDCGAPERDGVRLSHDDDEDGRN